MSALVLADEQVGADLATYVGRAKRHDEDGAARLQALPAGDAGVLAVWTCVLPGAGLTRAGLVLGLRTLPLGAPPEPLDTVVALAALTDRLARAGAGSAELHVPPTTVTASWAAVSPPRGGWQPVGSLPASRLYETATAGIVEVATGTPQGAGSSAVADLRSRVWGRRVEVPNGSDGASVPAGAAFGMHVLGFLGEDPVTVHAQGPWVRLTSRAGYVLAR